MKRITSGENQLYKTVSQLKQKKYREEQQRYLIEGPNLVREALNNGARIEMILRSDDYGEENLRSEQLDLAMAEVPVTALSSELFRKLSDTETPQGILAVVKKKIYTEDEFFSTEAVSSNVIVLDRLQDPGNIGTILRTADAAGYLGAILLKGTADIYSPKIVRAATGSLFRLPVLFADSPETAIRMLRRRRKKIICTALDCSSFYYDADLKENAAVIIGNEGNGVCGEFLEESDVRIKIPMEGTIESLNAAVAAGILMYESVRQRHQR